MTNEQKSIVVITKKGKDESKRKASATLAELALKGWEYKTQIENAQKQVKQINSEILKKLEVGQALVIEGVGRCTPTQAERYSISDLEELKTLLGPRFKDLTTQSVSYTASAKLKEMACDEDYAKHAELQACFSISQSLSARWTGEKTKKDSKAA
ncbi:hypothetical protein [Pseudoalteromonas aurantia]|uniref:Uncharacterized protein n=1 Tax=Pseudoalteromonas aurantia 208 TaxID=1314867 RepID=A0ABR9EBA2_9GAMM|nr:hypothetical protein [Pseudoalteromonas aurantia]MBE0368258.1 hypothetical protein [Pseudoalteromonas aurantia 208]